jgi:hypothetical protein
MSIDLKVMQKIHTFSDKHITLSTLILIYSYRTYYDAVCETHYYWSLFFSYIDLTNEKKNIILNSKFEFN